VPPDRQQQRGPSGPSFDKPESLPTELESKEMSTPPAETPPATPPAEKKGKP
jgi:hypothetical protein